MKLKRLGQSGLKVSELCLGCMTFGEPGRGGHPWTLPQDQSAPLIRAALDAGITFFDTANVYSDGSSEEILGEVLWKLVPRHDIVLATKVHGDARPDIFAEGPLACDEFGCRYQAGARKVSFALHAGSHTDECAWADVLIADDPVRIYPCAAAVVIDWFDLWRAGAHAVWLDDLRVRSVKGQRGARLWTISHTR